MKKNIVNILATTGISLLLLSSIALSFHASCIYWRTVFQTFGVNIITHLGILYIKKLELKSNITEIVLEITLIVCELLVFGRLFHWFTSLSFLLLVCVGVAEIKIKTKELEKEHGKKKNRQYYQYDIYFVDDY